MEITNECLGNKIFDTLSSIVERMTKLYQLCYPEENDKICAFISVDNEHFNISTLNRVGFFCVYFL